jgi:predicted GIY-YIG superfamily endonuclease
MFNLYILKSINFGNYYIGVANDIENRLKQHNSGLVRSTKHKRPWIIIHKELFQNQSEARKKERYLKSQKSRIVIERIIKHF